MTMDYTRFKALIQNRKDEILSLNSLSSVGADAVELDQTKVGRLSRMDALQIQEMNLATKRRRDRELVGLDLALKRIETDEYGVCQDCGDDINIKRLEIDLAAPRCIKCASAHESR